jgi:glycosyltransferase involved in cell wall biosynthesis
MKVCFVIPSLTSGGAERVAVTVLSALDAARHERVLYLFSGEGGVYFDRIAPDVRVVIASRRSWPGRLWELARFIRATRPDVVMPFLSYFITAMAVWVSRVPACVIFNQGTPTTGFLDDPDFAWRRPWKRRLFAMLTRLFYQRADAVVVTSAGVADDLAVNYGVPRARLRVLHNPVDIEAIAAAASLSPGGPVPRPLVVAAGRLAGVKNYPLLLAAIATIVEPVPVHLWILGEGDERAGLEALAAAPALAGRVRFLGFQQNPWAVIATADVFALTSTYEGFGNVLVEAMVCGTPVVATRSPGTAEIIEHGGNGLLTAHDVASVAAAINAILGDGGMRGRLVAKAREDVNHYALPRVAQRYERLFAELAA